jgi:hypothetical protein
MIVINIGSTNQDQQDPFKNVGASCSNQESETKNEVGNGSKENHSVNPYHIEYNESKKSVQENIDNSFESLFNL